MNGTRRCLTAFLLTFSLVGVFAASAHAQIAPGQRIRVMNGRQRISEGVFLGVDSLRYALILNGTDTVRIPIYGGYTAERGTERDAGSVIGKGTSIGVNVGLGLGVAFAVLNKIAPANPPVSAATVAIASIIVTAFTATVGAAVGAFIAVGDHEVWEAVNFTPDSVVAGAVPPAPGG